jgi:MerR family mercuric resistance operon transcriptional regulator
MLPNTIGAIAKRAGVGVETVRFYERQGLIRQPAARKSGFRQYPDEIVDRIRFIRHAKDLGFTLTEVGQLLSLRAHPRINCETVQRRAKEKIDDVDAKIRALSKIKTQLQKLARACDQREATADCPILEALK